VSGFSTKGNSISFLSQISRSLQYLCHSLPAGIKNASAVSSGEVSINARRISLFDSPTTPPFFWLGFAAVGKAKPRNRIPSHAQKPATGR